MLNTGSKARLTGGDLPVSSRVDFEAVKVHQRVLAIVLAGGRGSRLGPLTQHRAKPAVAFGGRYRIIDFTLANCICSGVRQVAVLAQYQSQSLLRHLNQNWVLPKSLGEFVEVLPAQQRDGDGWFAGTADAVFKNIDLITKLRPDVVLVLGADHVYKMDYRRLLADHAASGAAVSVACVEVPIEEASDFGVLQVDDALQVVGWQEKPRSPKPMPGSSKTALASMGIYAFDSAALVGALRADHAVETSSHDFGHDVVPALLRAGCPVHAHPFSASCVGTAGTRPYWRDVGTLDAYWEANIDLTRDGEGCDLSTGDWSPPGAADCGPPSRFSADADGRISLLTRSLLGSGCAIGAADIRDSVVFSDVSVGHGAQICESLLLPEAEIGAGVRLHRVIVDQRCRLPAGLVAGFDAEQDRRRFHVTARGITLITAEMFDNDELAALRPSARPAPRPSGPRHDA